MKKILSLLAILWSITVSSQTTHLDNDSTYFYWTSQIEETDAAVVDTALMSIATNMHTNALPFLGRVIANTPREYSSRIVQESVEIIKSWDIGEFIYYASIRKKEGDVSKILWYRNAYPRAYFYLGFVYNHVGEYTIARSYLQKGQELEPTNPRFWKEIGFSYSEEKNYTKALECYSHVNSINKFTQPEIFASVLRAKGFCYIELDQLVDARQCYTESLKYAPENALAKNQLEYINHLESGGEKRPTQITTTISNTLTCFLCKQEAVEIRFIELRGVPFRICKACLEEARKK